MRANETLSTQIYEHVKDNIEKGVYADGRLPTEMELAKQFYVSRITSKNALSRLAKEGLITRIQGKGSFVNQERAPHRSPFQSPKAGTAHTIALVMGGYTSSFGLDVLNGALEEAQAQQCHLIVKATNNDQECEAQIIAELMRDGVTGMIVQPVHGEVYSKQIISALYAGFPIVMLDRRMQGIEAPFVGVDNRVLSRCAVQKLLEAGHKSIALLALADERSSTIRERIEGYMEAFVDAYLPVDKELWRINMNSAFDKPPELLNPSVTYESYVSQIEAHLRDHPEITAVFGTEYRVSKAAWDAARRLKKRVPQELSLVSFDMDSSYVGSHTMSYIKQPQHEMGRKAVKLLCATMRQTQQEELQCLLPGEWVDGGTVAAAKR
ncbi:MAG: GntR family transcriptional regulator [Candidatus Limiplasma sp.]|nr:GntR family transcriptional regulator [Candidatus Limiplasma sp.]